MSTRNRYNVLFIAVALFYMLQTSCFAGPANPDIIAIRQPDGSTFQGRIRGDEFRGWVETVEGYTILKNERNDFWEYALPDQQKGGILPSGNRVVPGVPAPRQLLKHLAPEIDLEKVESHRKLLRDVYQERLDNGSYQSSPLSATWDPVPVSGNRKMLVILVNFADRALTTTATGWNAVLFETGTTIKSLRQFYRDNSFGLLDILPIAHTQAGNPTGVVAVTLTIAHPNYGKNYNITVESAWLNLALAAAAPYVDFASLDTNGDGIIAPNEAVVYFIPAGYEASGTAKTPNIWAHAWGGDTVSAGSKILSRWAMNGELNQYDVQQPMGVIAHEMGHAMAGLPDLYDTSNTNDGLGAFSLMAAGSWGAAPGEYSGTTPVLLDAWSREYLAWTSPVVPVSNGQNITLGTSLSANSAAVKLINSTVSTSEYFLAENRYPTGWDRGLMRDLGGDWPGGLLVMHIDNNVGNLEDNSINKYVAGQHQGVIAVQANNAAYASGGTAQTLYYAGNNGTFGNSSTPSSAYYGGAQSNVGFTNVSTPGTTMTFTFQSNQTGFADITGNWAYNYIMAIYNAHYTTGYNGTNYFMPDLNVSREQMAAFVIRAKSGEPATDYCSTGSPFADCPPSSWSCKYIKKLFELGITTGYNGTNQYMPALDVTRAQMAAFIIRAKEGEPAADTCAGGIVFTDVPTSDWSCKYIKRLYDLGITTGYGGTNQYMPNLSVTRAQMAAFLARAFLNIRP